MKRKAVIILMAVMLTAATVCTSCGAAPDSGTSGQNFGTLEADSNSAEVVSERNMGFEEYFQSKHAPEDNNLVYFFTENTDRENCDFYLFIISSPLSEEDWRKGLTQVAEQEIEWQDWFDAYSPVVIQDDAYGRTMAAFSLPKDVKNIRLLVQKNARDTETLKMDMRPLDYDLTDDPEQYYLALNNSEGATVAPITREEMESQLDAAGNYAAQLGGEVQRGFITAPENRGS